MRHMSDLKVRVSEADAGGRRAASRVKPQKARKEDSVLLFNGRVSHGLILSPANGTEPYGPKQQTTAPTF
ncbi:hypothetical protein GCM10023063_48690 [Arthrobacter methylotrophus]